jgi:transposase
LGLPVELQLTPGQQADVAQAELILEGDQPDAVLAVKGNDSDTLVRTIEAKGTVAVIPPKSNRKKPRDYDRDVHEERNLVERFMNRTKHYRRVASRYEKTARNFLGFVHVASIMVLLHKRDQRKPPRISSQDLV